MKTVCIPGDYGGFGGPGIFQKNLTQQLEQYGIGVTNDLNHRPLDAVCIIAAQRNLAKIWRCKRQGIRIVQRLNGINWMHRVVPTTIGHKIKAITANWLCAFIRRRMADHVVYQSVFSNELWETRFGQIKIPTSIVHNGVNLETFRPCDSAKRQQLPPKVIVVEGNLSDGYEHGLKAAVALVNSVRESLGVDISLEVVGNAAPQVIELYPMPWIKWSGKLPHDSVVERLRESHLFFASDLHPACPNSVLEAMACGVPVVGYDTGAVGELIGSDGGCVVPYGADAWKLEPPSNHEALVSAALKILNDHEAASTRARERALEFAVEQMTNRYLEVLL